jgi:predicted MPP superfamily phosphohydrolase
MFELAHSRMYISRGVGFLKRMRLLCRPEVPTYVLRALA